MNKNAHPLVAETDVQETMEVRVRETVQLQPTETMEARPRGSGADLDRCLEKDLLRLLSNLEYCRVRLDSLKGHGKDREVLQLITTMLDQVVDVAEQQMCPRQCQIDFSVALGRASELQTSIQTLEREIKRSPLRMILRLFGKPCLTERESRQVLHDVGRSFHEVLQHFFSAFRRCLHSSRPIQEWDHLSARFLKELRQIFDQLSASKQ